MKILQALMPIFLLVITCIYCQIVIKRDKKFRKQYAKRIRAIEKEERRRVKEEELKMVCIQHPKVLYLNDFRPSQQILKKV